MYLNCLKLIFQGELSHLDAAKSKNDCWIRCRNDGKCNWFSFDLEDMDCLLFTTCPEIQATSKFISGQKECDYSTQYSKCTIIQQIPIESFYTPMESFYAMKFHMDLDRSLYYIESLILILTRQTFNHYRISTQVRQFF